MASPGTRCRTAIFLGTTDMEGNLPSRLKEKLPELTLLQEGQVATGRAGGQMAVLVDFAIVLYPAICLAGSRYVIFLHWL